MTDWVLDKKLSIGVIITMLSVFVAVIMSWASIGNNQERLADNIKTMQDESKAAQAKNDARISALETRNEKITSIDVTLGFLVQGLNNLSNDVKSLNEKKERK